MLMERNMMVSGRPGRNTVLAFITTLMGQSMFVSLACVVVFRRLNEYIRYEGEWKHDKKHGKGNYFHVEGARYEGEWKHGEKSGFGVYHYADRDRFVCFPFIFFKLFFSSCFVSL